MFRTPAVAIGALVSCSMHAPLQMVCSCTILLLLYLSAPVLTAFSFSRLCGDFTFPPDSPACGWVARWEGQWGGSATHISDRADLRLGTHHPLATYTFIAHLQQQKQHSINCFHANPYTVVLVDDVSPAHTNSY